MLYAMLGIDLRQHKNGNSTLEDLFRAYRQDGIQREWSEAHKKNVYRRIQPLIKLDGWLTLADINCDFIKGRLNEIWGHRAVDNYNRIRADWRAFFNWCVKPLPKEFSPAHELPTRKRTEAKQLNTPTPKDFLRLKQTAIEWVQGGCPRNRRDGTIWFLTADAALRLREVADLKASAIAHALEFPHKSKQGTVYALQIVGKMRVEWVTFTERTAFYLRNYLRWRTDQKPNHDWLWISTRPHDAARRVIKDGAIKNAFPRLGDAAGVTENKRSHALRYFNAWYLATKFGIKYATKKLRHTSEAFTSRVYLQSFPVELLEANISTLRFSSMEELKVVIETHNSLESDIIRA